MTPKSFGSAIETGTKGRGVPALAVEATVTEGKIVNQVTSNGILRTTRQLGDVRVVTEGASDDLVITVMRVSE